MPSTWTMISVTGDAQCIKCAADIKRGKRVSSPRALYALQMNGKSWPLCASHSAAVCHKFHIPHRVFTPELLTSTQ